MGQHPTAESKSILSEKTDTELVKGARNKDTHKGLSKPQLQAQKMSRQSYIAIHEDIKEELRKGNYKVNIAPSDLFDIGGHKSFDMTHQLFIQHKGEFILMFNGKFDLCDPLQKDLMWLYSLCNFLFSIPLLYPRELQCSFVLTSSGPVVVVWTVLYVCLCFLLL
jgi:hypothetical protein